MVDKGYIYILQNQKGNYYIGSTKNLARRIEEHSSGVTKSTRYKGPWKLVFCQEYEDLINARRIEYKIKRLKNRNIVEKIIREQKIRMGD